MILRRRGGPCSAAARRTFQPPFTINWDKPVTVTVTGKADGVTGPVAYTIALWPATSTDTNYNGLDPADVSVTNLDSTVTTTTVSSTNVPMPIPDLGMATSSLAFVGAPTRGIVTLSLTLSITHARASDLTVILTSPAGTSHVVGGTSGTFAITTFNGELPNGPWTLQITDGKKVKTGTLNSWSLAITN